MLEERYMGPEYDLDELSKLPKDTLGYNYAFLMKTMGFEPHFYRSRDLVVTRLYSLKFIFYQ